MGVKGCVDAVAWREGCSTVAQPDKPKKIASNKNLDDMRPFESGIISIIFEEFIQYYFKRAMGIEPT